MILNLTPTSNGAGGLATRLRTTGNTVTTMQTNPGDPYPLTPEEEEKGGTSATPFHPNTGGVGEQQPAQPATGRKSGVDGFSGHYLQRVIALAYGCFFFYSRFEYAHQESNLMFQATGMQKERNVSKMLKEGKPVSVLLMGTDTGALGRDFKGRTDTMIVCVMTPRRKR